MTDTELKVLSVLAKAESGSFNLLVRWLLGDGEHLPLHDDRFRVRAMLKPSGQAIFADGRVGPPDGSEWIAVGPRNYTMIDPPRRSEAMNEPSSDDLYYRMVALRPEAPIDPAASAGGTLRKETPPGAPAETHAMGVRHLLEESELSREAWRVADAASAPLRHRLAALRAERPGALGALNALGATVEDAADVSAKALARYLIETGMRPLDLPKVMTEAVARFRAGALAAAAAGQEPGPMPRVFALPGAGIAAESQHAALLAATLNDWETIDRIDVERTSRLSARQQLRLRSLQGGELIDFWCDPDGATDECPSADRGARYPASELIGCGLRIFGIAPELVRVWAEGNDRQFLEVEVEHLPGATPRPETPLGGAETEGPGHLDVGDLQPTQWQPGRFVLTPTDLKRALTSGGSHLPPPPAHAEINYDLIQSNAGDTGKAEEPEGLERRDQLTFETGEGKVQILIAPPTPPGVKATVFSFNLYGVWEGAPGTKRLFSDPPDDPTGEELKALLKPWRLSARYSFSRDLKLAFSDLHPHPALEAALADPPWFPILIRPTASYEPEPQPDPQPEEDNGMGPERPGRPLPLVGRDGMTAASVDLRKGLSFKPVDTEGYDVKWDPFGPIELDWTPDLDRVGQPACGRPQRYRFWVSSVDAFEQESVPVPVRAEDADAGEPESVIYTPRYRTPLPPPRGFDDTGPRIGFDAAQGLVVTWRTPLAERIGVDGSVASEVLDKRRLRARVRLYRKRIGRVKRPDVRASALETAGDLPQWQALAERMQEQGFERFGGEVAEIMPPAQGEEWRHVFPVDWADRGFEYKAGIVFEVTEDWRPYWAPDVIKGPSIGRQALMQVLVDDDWVPRQERLSEVPRVSDVSLSDGHFLTNDKTPRAPKLGEGGFTAAFPVPPVQDIERDLVLLRLLSHDVAGAARAPWRDTGVELTQGQVVMCETAIARVRREGGLAPEPGEPRLADLRRIFASRLDARQGARAENASIRRSNVLNQHPTVGFRGIQTLSWRYTPFAVAPPRPGAEAEAAAVRIYQVRVPLTLLEARSYATLRGSGHQIEGRRAYRLTEPKTRDSEVLTAIATAAGEDVEPLSQPAAVLIRSEEGQSVALAAAIDITDPEAPEITVDRVETMPAAADILVFAGHELLERPIADFARASEERVELPVGGGFDEVFVWWLVAVSAQGREAAVDDRPAVVSRFQATVAPEPPALFTAGPPTDRHKHWLKPDDPKLRHFIPSFIRDGDEGRARNNPRLLLSWRDPRPALDAGLALYRWRRKISREAPREVAHGALDEGPTPWEACKAIEAIGEGDEIPAAALAALADGWLTGKPILPPDGTIASVDKEFIGRGGGLSSRDGLLTVDVPVETALGRIETEARPGFVDYFYANDDPVNAMEGSFAYAYSAERVIDLDPDGRFELPKDVRYLPSRRTPWTPFYVAATPPFEIVADTPVPADTPPLPATATPEVVFRFRTPRSGSRLFSTTEENPVQYRDWSYRIVLSRRIDAGFSSNPGKAYETQWVQISRAVSLDYDVGEVEVVDRGIDRVAPDQPVHCWYRIGVTQYAKLVNNKNEEIGEVLVRRGLGETGEDFIFDKAIEVPAMLMRPRTGVPAELVGERRVLVPVTIE